MLEELIKSAREFNINLEDNISKFQVYMDTLIEWNQKMNLTAITEPKEIVEKHFLDSLTLAKFIEFKDNTKVIDVGTGAGFPGVPLKIAFKNIDLTLLDSLQKRLNFLDCLLKKIDLKANLLHLRAEEGGRKPELRENFDVALARAVARLDILAEYCMPYVKVGGVFAAMKQYDIEEEVNESKNKISVLGGSILSVKYISLPNVGERSIIIVKKIKNTPRRYPRRFAIIKSSRK